MRVIGLQRSPIIHDSHFNESVQTTPGMADGDGERLATPHRETAEDVGTRSCPICCCDLALGGDALWTLPCSCHLDLHLNCAVQMHVREPRPRCPHCRMEPPGGSDELRLQAEVSMHSPARATPISGLGSRVACRLHGSRDSRWRLGNETPRNLCSGTR